VVYSSSIPPTSLLATQAGYPAIIAAIATAKVTAKNATLNAYPTIYNGYKIINAVA